MRFIVTLIVFVAGLVTYKKANACDYYKITGDTTTPKKINGVSYNKQSNKFEVRYFDGSTEAMNRQTLDERNIYYPGHPEKNDTLETKQDIYEKEASVDLKAWKAHLDQYIPTYIDYAVKKGMRAGDYRVNVRFLINADGSLSNFTATPNPGYKFIEFITAIFSNGPKWSPSEQNGQKLRSIHTQPISFSIKKAYDFQ